MSRSLQILSIDVERSDAHEQCGTLRFAAAADEPVGAVLWVTQWARAAHVSVEFVPAEGADQDFVRTHHADLVEAVVATVRAQVGRKALLS